MVRKSLNVMKGVKVKTIFCETKSVPHKHHASAESQERIDNCLNCKKPAKECRGTCYGRNV